MVIYLLGPNLVSAEIMQNSFTSDNETTENVNLKQQRKPFLFLQKICSTSIPLGLVSVTPQNGSPKGEGQTLISFLGIEKSHKSRDFRTHRNHTSLKWKLNCTNMPLKLTVRSVKSHAKKFMAVYYNVSMAFYFHNDFIL